MMNIWIYIFRFFYYYYDIGLGIWYGGSLVIMGKIMIGMKGSVRCILNNSLIFLCFEFLSLLLWLCKNELIFLLNYLWNVNLYFKVCLINCILILFYLCF